MSASDFSGIGSEATDCRATLDAVLSNRPAGAGFPTATASPSPSVATTGALPSSDALFVPPASEPAEGSGTSAGLMDGSVNSEETWDEFGWVPCPVAPGAV